MTKAKNRQFVQNSFYDPNLTKEDTLNLLHSAATLTQMPVGEAVDYFRNNAFPTSRGSIFQEACFWALCDTPEGRQFAEDRRFSQSTHAIIRSQQDQYEQLHQAWHQRANRRPDRFT